jgi:nucleoside 2-deoxyribosyltransferase
MTKHIYLAGAILGCNFGEANDWRKHVDSLFIPGIKGISPLRCEPLHGERYSVSYPDPRFGTPRAIASKNFYDVTECAGTFAFLPKPPPDRKQSWGTIIEVAWAMALNKPVIVVTDDKDVWDHPVLDACIGWKIGTTEIGGTESSLAAALQSGVDTANGVFGGYVPAGKSI